MVGLVCGLTFSSKWLKLLKLRNAPIVTGQVVSRTKIRVESVPKVDFAIRIDGTSDLVHARTGRYLLNRIPNNVRFRYSGNPAEEVVLLDYERSPFWFAVLGWVVCIVFLGKLILRFIRVRPADPSEPIDTCVK
jgi:hypothetical protein